MKMSITRAPARVIKSIRQISLNREWVRLRGHSLLPNLSDFEPDSRAGDAHELSVTEVAHSSNGFRLLVHQAGDRAERAAGGDSTGKYLDELLPPPVVANAMPLWHACITEKLPVFCHVQTADGQGKPVTLEHLYLPFSANHVDTLYMVASLQVFAEEGNYQVDRLFQQNEGVAVVTEAYLIDPDRTFAETVSRETGIELI